MTLEYSSSLFSLHPLSITPPLLSSSIRVCVFVQTNEEQFTQQKPALYGKNERKFFFLNCRVESEGLKTDQKRERDWGWVDGEEDGRVEGECLGVSLQLHTSGFRENTVRPWRLNLKLLWPETLQPWRTESERERGREIKSIISGMF